VATTCRRSVLLSVELASAEAATGPLGRAARQSAARRGVESLNGVLVAETASFRESWQLSPRSGKAGGFSRASGKAGSFPYGYSAWGLQ
jgi:hypothetical protein